MGGRPLCRADVAVLVSESLAVLFSVPQPVFPCCATTGGVARGSAGAGFFYERWLPRSVSGLCLCGHRRVTGREVSGQSACGFILSRRPLRSGFLALCLYNVVCCVEAPHFFVESYFFSGGQQWLKPRLFRRGASNHNMVLIALLREWGPFLSAVTSFLCGSPEDF